MLKGLKDCWTSRLVGFCAVFQGLFASAIAQNDIGLTASNRVNAVKGQPATLSASYVSSRRLVTLMWGKVDGEPGGKETTVYMYSPGLGLQYALGPLEGRAELVGKASLKIREIELSDEGAYSVSVVLDKLGEERKYVHLNVMVPPRVTVGPANPYVVEWSQNVTLSCTTKDAKPPIKALYWEKDGERIQPPNRDSGKYVNGNMNAPFLLVRNVSKEEAGNYACVVDHVTGKHRSALTLKVLYPAIITNITKQVATDVISLHCFADGNPKPEIMWTKAGSFIPLDSKHFPDDGMATHVLANVRANDSGVYICTARNGYGVAESRSLRIIVADEVQSPWKKTPQIAIIAGVSAAAAWVIVCTVLVACSVHRRMKRNTATVPRYALQLSYLEGKRKGANEHGRKYARVLYDYDPKDDDELQLRSNDIIDIIRGDNEGWWFGYLNGRCGLFPSNYVELITVTEREALRLGVPENGITGRNTDIRASLQDRAMKEYYRSLPRCPKERIHAGSADQTHVNGAREYESPRRTGISKC
ncbi:nectin-4-like isoform X1 [Branchiostoma lanceolatum]